MTIDPNTLTDYDLLQLIDLDTKADHEGLAYACENWGWDFDNPELTEAFAAAADGDTVGIKTALRATYARRERWWAAHPHPTQIPALEAHEAEVERREREGVTR